MDSKQPKFSEQHYLDEVECWRNAAQIHAKSAAVQYQKVTEGLDRFHIEKKRNEAILNQLNDAVVVVDESGEIIIWNRAATNLLGINATRAIGRPFDSMTQRVFPELTALARQEWARPVPSTKRHVLAFGRLYIRCKFRCIAIMGLPHQLILLENSTDAVVLQHSKEHEKEELERRVLERTEQLQLHVDARNQIATALKESELNLVKAQQTGKIGNWSLERQTGRVRGSLQLFSVLGVPGPDLDLDTLLARVHPEERERVRILCRSCLGDGTAWSFEHRLATADKSLQWVCTTGEAVLALNGTVAGIVGVIQDITARKQHDELLHRSQKMDALGQLTGGVAHDYNNMLMVISGFAELLEEHLVGQPEPADYAREIVHASRRGAKLTAKLLAFSRKRPSDAKRVDIGAVLLGQRDMLAKTLTARVELSYTIAEDLWPVCLDDGDLEDAMVNLSINAGHAIRDAGSLSVHADNLHLSGLEARKFELAPGRYVRIRVCDTGCGMSEATQQRVFEPFFSTKDAGGTGLGLSQVYGFVGRSHGTITVHSELDVGTTFTMLFPHDRSSQENAQAQAAPNSTLHGGTETILIVDDEPALLYLASQTLRAKGYDTICARSASQALELLADSTVDLLLTDVVMPDVDGYALARVVRQRHPTVRILLASGYPETSNGGRAAQAAQAAPRLRMTMLHKPYSSTQLLTRVRTVLDGDSNRRHEV